MPPFLWLKRRVARMLGWVRWPYKAVALYQLDRILCGYVKSKSGTPALAAEEDACGLLQTGPS